MLGGRRDPHFGPVVSVGLGGTLVELLDDAALRLAPLGPREAAAMLTNQSGPIACRLARCGASDRDAVFDAMQRLGAFLAAYPEIAEIDVNPLFVAPAEGCVRCRRARVHREEEHDRSGSARGQGRFRSRWERRHRRTLATRWATPAPTSR